MASGLVKIGGATRLAQNQSVLLNLEYTLAQNKTLDIYWFKTWIEIYTFSKPGCFTRLEIYTCLKPECITWLRIYTAKHCVLRDLIYTEYSAIFCNIHSAWTWKLECIFTLMHCGQVHSKYASTVSLLKQKLSKGL